jgi:SOS-response transcriptional repressor LexA
MTTTNAADPEAVRRLMHLGLTGQQARVFHFLFTSTMTTGVQPSFRDTCDAFGFGSLNAVRVHLNALSRKGWIAPTETRSRSVRFRRTVTGSKFVGFVLPEDEP